MTDHTQTSLLKLEGERRAFMSAYSASKTGLVALTLSIAPEVKRLGQHSRTLLPVLV